MGCCPARAVRPGPGVLSLTLIVPWRVSVDYVEFAFGEIDVIQFDKPFLNDLL